MNMMMLLAPLNKFLRKLPGKGFPILIALVWTLGLASRKLNQKSCFLITIAIICVWLIYGVIVIIIRKSKKGKVAEKGRPGEQVIGFEEKLINAIGVAKDSPWYMIVGPSGSGKTSMVMNSDLEFSRTYSSQESPDKSGIKETKNCDLFLAREGIIMDTAGRYVNFGKDARVNKEWVDLISILRRHRKLRQIEGLVVVIDVSELLQDEGNNAEQQGRAVRDRIQEIASSLKTTFPVYLIFTKCDLIYGFADFFVDMTSAERMQVWGATLKMDSQENTETAFQRECENLFQSLSTRRLFKLANAKEPERRPIYTFPLQFDTAYQKLSRFVSALFPHVSKESPFLRGFYFTGITSGVSQPATGADKKELSPIEFVMQRVSGLFERKPSIIAQQSRVSGEPRGYFIRNVFTEIIFPDRDLARSTTAAEKRSMIIRLGICAACLFLALLLSLILVFSYFHTRNLMTEVQNQAALVSKIDDTMTPEQKRDTFEKLRIPIIELESFSFVGLPWNKQRYEVAEAARLLYLTDKYGSKSGYQVRLKRKVRLQVEVLKSNPEKPASDPNKFEPIPEVKIKATAMGKDYQLVTNKEGKSILKAKIADGKVLVTYKINHNEPGGFEVERIKEYEISPGETVSDNVTRFIYSKLRRTIEVSCKDQMGMPLAGVPVSIIDEKSKDLGKKDSNEQGVARFEIEAEEGSTLMVYYGDSSYNYKEETPDTFKTELGKNEYSIERQIRRKIQVSVTAFTVKEDDSQVPKPGVSISVGGNDLGTTDNAGQWSGPSAIIPNLSNVFAKPGTRSLEVHQTATGYSIVLKYDSASVKTSPTPSPKPPAPQEGPKSRSLTVTNSYQQGIRGAEVWVYSKGKGKISGTDNEMSFMSRGSQVKLLKIKGTTSPSGRMDIPREIQEDEFLLYHPDYWPQKVKLTGQSDSFALVSLTQSQSINDFDSSQINGSDYYHKMAKEKHQSWKRDEAILLYNKSLRLLPRKPIYFGLGWAYYETGKEREAKVIANKGLALSLQDPKTASLQSEYQKELRKLLEVLK